MHDSTTRFISRMKLRELRGHRARLDARYAELEATLSPEPDVAGLVALYEALDGMRLAGSPLHPELEHLEHVFEVFTRRAPEADVLRMWYDRVRHSLTRGRARARWVQLFGAALAQLADAAPPARDPPTQARLALYTRPAPTGDAHAVALSAALATLAPRTLEWVRAPWRPGTHEECPLRRRVDPFEVQRALSVISDDAFRFVPQRHHARAFGADDALTKELADALSLQLEHLEGWWWPTDTVDARAVRMRQRWRLQLDEDLPTACLLEVLGDRLAGHVLETFEGATRQLRAARLSRLRELDAPPIIIENERRMLEGASHQRPLDDVGIWEDTLGVGRPEVPPDPAHRSTYGSVSDRRRELRADLRRASTAQGYGQAGESSTIDALLGWVHAEVALARAAWPDAPVWVVKLDVEDFFPSVHHRHALDMLTECGLPDDLREVFARVLAVPTEGGTWTRGLPVGRRHSHALADLLMHLLERAVRDAVPVRVIRLVDDVCFLSPSREHAERAWEAARGFLEALDLRPNLGKCGAVGLNTSETSEVLPDGPPSWGLWELVAGEGGEATWRLHAAHLDALVEDARAKVHAQGSLLDSVRTYGEALLMFEQSLAMWLPLDATHRAAVGAALERFEVGVFGAQGPLEWCRARLDEGARDALTESLLHWPITAGGLGLRHAHVQAARAERVWRATGRPAPPDERGDDWEVRAQGWGHYFTRWTEPMERPRVPASPQMEALIQDFIQRGSEVGGRVQQGLGNYWRAVVQMYGPQILEDFGTFRFLLTELVPLRLITHGRDGLEDLSEGAGAQEGLPF
jgi:hypothetical protein